MDFKSLPTLKSLFFDTAAVEKMVSAARRRLLSRLGAYTRQRAKTSIRKREKSSPPGQPPSSHAGDLRRLILFAYDPAMDTVVVGPLVFKKGEAPALLEHGGTVTRKRKDGSFRKLTYRGNPFMRPAGIGAMDELRAQMQRAVK